MKLQLLILLYVAGKCFVVEVPGTYAVRGESSGLSQPKQPMRRDRKSIEFILGPTHRCYEHVRLPFLCSTNRLGVLRSSGGHERLSPSEAPFPWRGI